MIIMQKFGYGKFAKYYDRLYAKKDYAKEAEFVLQLLKASNAKTVLDAGCGTGSHLKILESQGFECGGIDLNNGMLKVAKTKLKAKLYKKDMRNFNLGKKFDAIICMFATFNYNRNLKDAEKTLACFKKHINKGGLLIIDLHNPQSDGKKTDAFRNIERTLEWVLDRKSRIEKTRTTFKISGKTIKDSYNLRIFSIAEMKKLLKSKGFSQINAVENYTMQKASKKSKNIEIIAKFQ